MARKRTKQGDWSQRDCCGHLFCAAPELVQWLDVVRACPCHPRCQSPLLCAQFAGPHHLTGRARATCSTSFRTAASENRPTERRGVGPLSFRLRCRSPRLGAGDSDQQVVESRTSRSRPRTGAQIISGCEFRPLQKPLTAKIAKDFREVRKRNLFASFARPWRPSRLRAFSRTDWHQRRSITHWFLR